ncbi:uncharacterized protein BP5553_06939 [Venustampulla echinocandica]|uniref:Protein kinase-like (PK-like) n=1 Tax=Venustampulla echinocandica TaxID=2656787 RepID=A0A370TI22_9HELO|nr:uncharacterized protein BP5553_06939 [Venustampulla echinocandica]RDL35008.1 hypothetical protein BP5553_06939 [Venustampulla echinocandica]
MAEQPPSGDDPIALLEAINEETGRKQEISIFPGYEIRIGRDDNCDLSIPEVHISKQHCRIYSIIYERVANPQFPPLVYCEDLESSNGTYVNGVRIGTIGGECRGYLLSDGDIIHIRPNWKLSFSQLNETVISRERTELNDLQHFHDRFDVTDRLLGTGQFGSVYLAKEVATSRQMACKIVKLDLAGGQKPAKTKPYSNTGDEWQTQALRAKDGREIVMREVKILSRLKHPHIINLKKAFRSSNTLYLFTELASGGDLFSYLDSHGGVLQDWQSRVISFQIVLAIEYLHSNNIAHRDIKPENILISQTGFGGRVMLTDFGFANSVNEKTGRLMSAVGTEGYVAPEVKAAERSTEGYKMSADLWSLGVLTACLLTGQSLIPREDLSQLTQVDIADRFLGISDSYTREDWSDLSSTAQLYLRRLLVLDPEKRMTAKEALQHPWFRTPSSEASLLQERYHRIIRFWNKSANEGDVIENLPSYTDTTQAEDRSQPKFRRKFHDASSSPYFGLDRHLHKRTSPKRQAILEMLHESGSHFISSQHAHKARVPNAEGLNMPAANIVTVDASDLFGTSSQAEPDRDEVDLIPTGPYHSLDRTSHNNMN